MIPGCANSTSTGQCIACSQYYLPNNLTSITSCTQSFIPNCQTASSATTCTSCVAGFALTNNTCIGTLPNCTTFNVATSLCTQCQVGFLPINGYPTGSCESCGGPCPAFCTAVANQQCVGCSAGFFPYNDQCVTLPYGCAVGSVKGCTNCSTGFLPSVLPTPAAPIIPGCYKNNVWNCAIANATNCLGCMPGYNLSAGQCDPTIPNCVSYSQWQCVVCANGYLLLNSQTISKCVQCANGGNCVPGCVAVNSSGVCSLCNIGWYPATLSNGSQACLALPFGCAIAGPYGSCQECLGGYLPNGSYASTSSFISCFECQVPNCNFANASGVCQSCIKDFTLINNSCNETVANCQSYYNGICQACNTGYLPNDPGFITSCFKCAGSGCNVNCSAVNNKGVCVRCIQGMYISNGACNSLMPNCAIGSSATSCIECLNGYAPTSYPITQCLKTNSSNCTLVNVTANNATVCTQCALGYSLDSTPDGIMCVENTPNCVYYNGNGQCIQCQAGYLPSNSQYGDCVPCPGDNCPYFCMYLGITTQVCTQCINGYYLNLDSICAPAPLGCGLVSAEGVCLQCASHYAPNNLTNISTCIYNYVSNCILVSASNQSCLQCAQNFTLSVIQGNQHCVPNGMNVMLTLSRGGIAGTTVILICLVAAIILLGVFMGIEAKKTKRIAGRKGTDSQRAEPMTEVQSR